MAQAQSVARLVARPIAIVMAIVVLFAVIGVTSLSRIQRELTEFREQVTPAVDTVRDVQLTFTRTQVAYRGYLATGLPDYLQPYQTARQNFVDAESRLRGLPAAILPEDAIPRLRRASAQWIELAEGDINARTSGRVFDLAPTVAVADTVNRELDGMVTNVETVRKDRRAAYERLTSLGLWFTIGATVLALVVGIWLARQIVRNVARPIRALGDVVTAHATGQDDVRADPTLGTREVRAVATAYNSLADDRHRMIQRQAWDLRLHEASEAIAGVLAVIPSTDGGWSPACERLGTSLDLDGVFVYSWAADRTLIPLGGWTSPAKQGAKLVVPQAVDEARQSLNTALTGATPAQIAAVFPPGLGAAATNEGIRAWTLRPLVVGSDVVGVVSVWSMRDHAWEPEELEAVDRFAFYAARAVTEQRYVETLRRLDARKSDFLATTSHELRTPLTSVSGYLEMLREGDFGELSAQQAKAWTIVDRNVTRLRALIEDLLIINQLDSGKGSTAVDTPAVGVILERLREALTPIAATREIQLHVHDHTGDQMVRGDRDQIERAITNVVSNSIKFTPPGGSVTVTAEPDGDMIAVKCVDTGIGIPPEDQAALFTRFFRASNANAEQIQGTGLGLAISQAIIEGHGGSIAVDSILGTGTTVRVFLPCYTTPDDAGSHWTI